MKQNKIKKIVFDTCNNYELQYSFNGEQQLKTILKSYNIKDVELFQYYREYITYCVNNDLI